MVNNFYIYASKYYEIEENFTIFFSKNFNGTDHVTTNTVLSQLLYLQICLLNFILITFICLFRFLLFFIAKNQSKSLLQGSDKITSYNP